MSGLRQVMRDAAARLAEAGVPSPDADVVELVSFVLRIEPSEVRRRMIVGAELTAAQEDRLGDLIEGRSHRIPLQHLTGRAYFRHLTLQVGPGVFVPRPETEMVAGLAIEAARAAGPAPVVVDLGTGSGAIALAVADEVPAARVYAVELSDLAVAWARRNVEALGSPVELRQGEAAAAFPELEGGVDVVVSNPPYIPAGQVPVDPEVRDHDPELALYGGSADGLTIPLAVAARAARLLRPGGVFVMEHADTQGEALVRVLRRESDSTPSRCHRWVDVVDHLDLTGRPRAVVARRAAGEGQAGC
ncbi:peptide chain release factor N(5)-glutamine methyltransferase [Nostocoides australiense]|nr:peptide chain release factor N(5)-glutamine methyltransferase [Tetrasphaera australiensis]